jgi:phage/plasmid-like protein (TIGR03299 family)
MSRETMQWLNTMTLIGYKDKRGHAWHHRAEYQGDEPNHYDGPVPVEDVLRRLFDPWEIKAAPLEFTVPAPIKHTIEGVTVETDRIIDPSRQVIYNGSTGHVFYVASDGYVIHHYGPWLLDTVANILDDDLQIGSAGLLEQGGVAWVQVELPETVKGPGDFEYRPYIFAMTSCNGSKATTFGRAAQAIVCDNTLNIADSEGGHIRIKHTAGSALRISEARDALNVLVASQDAVDKELETLLSVKVDDVQWQKFLDLAVPITDDMKPRGRTLAENKLGELNRLYKHDPRVAPWKGSGLGVMQAMNTFDQWIGTMRNLGDGNKAQARYGRSLMAAADGSLAKATANYRELLASVTDSQLVSA